VASAEQITTEAARRRTFAIISHPDAGKTTLTEKFLLYGGALGTEAGSVKGKRGGRAATSDWMELEQQRGISITSTVLQFPYRDHVVNLLDTPGHRDFSEDTYRVLAAADAAVMVLDAAKGIEPQTLKLFEVCRDREIPILTFINKWDRPSLNPLEILDDIEKQLSLTPTPLSWPVGSSEEFRGVLDQRTGEFVRFTRTARGSTVAPEEIVDRERAIAEEGDLYEEAVDELGLLEAVGAEYDEDTFLAGITTPVFFGSALTNFGVRLLLDAVVDLVPPPAPKKTGEDDVTRKLDAPFSGFVFKVQANMDKAHRDRTAFFRVCSGKFERGMVVTHQTTGKPIATKYAHTAFGTDRETLDEAWPGDIVGLVNANEVRIGDTLWLDDKVEFPKIPSFAPQHFAIARTLDTSRFKQFRNGISQLDEEGVVQVLRDEDIGDQAPVLAAVGPMQFEVATHRLENEFGAPVELSMTNYTLARRTNEESMSELDRLLGERPELMLEKLVAGAG